MTITTTATSSGPYTATGQTAFAVTFQSAGVGEIEVLLNGVVVNPGFYQHLRNADGTGSVVFSTGQTGTILINSVPSFQQQVSFAKYGAFYPDQINPALDRAAARSLMLKAKLDRTVAAPVGETLGPLPSAALRANMALGFASDGSLFAYALGAAGAGNETAATILSKLASLGNPQSFVLRGDGTFGASGGGGGLTTFTPEQYGAKGDGTTNDTVAFQQLATAVNAAGGGIIDLKYGVTYLVGLQTLTPTGPDWTYSPASICLIRNLSKPVIFRGNGAKMKQAAGLRYGVFNSDGSPNYTASGHAPVGFERASLGAYIPSNGGVGSEGMITIINCTAPVSVTDVELDGNNANAIMGGMSGDTGWQIPGDGLVVFNNTGGEYFRNIRSHNHMRDGGYGWREVNNFADNLPKTMSVFEECDFYANGRQGFSLTGGKGYTFRASRFRQTGRTVNTSIPAATYGNQQMSSAPAAGVDIEIEQGKVRDVLFEECEFADTVGCAFVADSGDSADVTFRRCTFIGTTNWSFWCSKPGYVVEECKIFGSFNPAYENLTDPVKSLKFIRCLFSDRVKYSPTGALFAGGINGGGGSFGRNTLYQYCEFEFGSNLGSPLGSIFDTCFITTGSLSLFSPRFRGFNTIRINVIGYGFGSNTPNYKIESGQVADYEPSGIATTNTQSGTAYTIALADNGGRVALTNSGATTVTVPTNANVNFPVGAKIELRPQGGTVTIVPDPAGGVVGVNPDPGSGSLTIEATNSLMVLTQTATNIWTLGPAYNAPIILPAIVGYDVGLGGAITQATSKTTGVVLNTATGNITTFATSIAASSATSFVLTDSLIGAEDIVTVAIKSGAADPSAYSVTASGNAAGSRTINIRNLTGGALAEAIVIGFNVARGSAS